MGRYEMKCRVRYSEVDPDLRLTTDAMINLLQDCATFHCEAVGYDVAYLMSKHLGWFVTDWQIAFEGETPKLGDEITVATWGYRFFGMFGYRNMTITRADGSIYARVNSLWILMDTAKGRPVKVPPEMLESFGTEPELEGPWKDRKIPLLENHRKIYSFTVNKLQLDSNDHMNNSYYITVAAACLPDDFETTMIRTEYKRQAREGDAIDVSAARAENTCQVILTDQEGGLYCTIEFERTKGES